MKKRMGALFFILLLICIVTAVAAVRHEKTKEEPIIYMADPVEEPVTEPVDLAPELQKQLDKAHAISQNEIREAKKVSENSVSEEPKESSTEPVVVDLIVFAGQSNMSGFGGNAAAAPKLTEGAGGEFRAISNPTCLYTITEPFGFYENSPVMNDLYGKNGTLVTAFVNAYYEETGVPVVAVSASKCGMSSNYWASAAVCGEVTGRYQSAYNWLNTNGYRVRHKYLVFLQGENDVIENVTLAQYLTNMNTFATTLYNNGLDKFFMIRIGRKKSDATLFDGMIQTQTELCRNNPNFVLASTVLSAYQEKDMVDEYHYTQQVLNDVGADAGKNVGSFTNTWIEPSMYDYKYQNEYVPEQLQ